MAGVLIILLRPAWRVCRQCKKATWMGNTTGKKIESACGYTTCRARPREVSKKYSTLSLRKLDSKIRDGNYARRVRGGNNELMSDDTGSKADN
jgi:hypothetical protein